MTNAPGKHYRKGISLMQAIRQFGDDQKAEAWLVKNRWPNGMACPFCRASAISPRKTSRLTPQYRCRACRKDFTVKTGTIMEDSKLPLGKWAMAFYLVTTKPEGRLQHEAPPRPRYHAEDRVVHGAPDPGDVG